jgi:DNA invertase Pin-like site-specific DNA recombinase
MKKTSQYRRRGSLHRHGIPDSPLVRAHLDTRNVLYIRASTEDQKLTLEGQEFEGREWSELRGLTTELAFIEPGVSGSKPFLERKEAMRAIEYMEKHGIPTLLVMDQDRGFRDTFDLLQTVDYLLEKGICLRLATPDIVIFDPYTRFVATVLAAVGELQLGQIKKNQKRAFNQMRREKVALSQNPSFGWELGEEIPDQLSKSGKPYRRLEPVPEEQAILREIIARYEARETLQAIADSLNQRGVRTKQAGKSITYKEKLVATRGGGTRLRPAKTITFSGEWKPQTVKSVIEHAEIAEES